MEFCPKCGKLLVPVKKDDKTILVCKYCNYEKLVEPTSSYKIVQQVEEGKRRKTLVSEEPIGIKKRKEEEKELISDYYKVFLESYEEESEEQE
ncbi:MAG: DNA-directed RNA polymerase subunit M [Candidatus Methanomethylicia archaeon]|nr:DNA-directed RNA polymerase subunit M [Candidatus Methanomethylicia archaeon]MCQ5340830.1 DNA-directed RNA polymerase subunit M [Candidatus Methanomethylicia archaeon]NHV45365.1 DNA-directed RNA polymerase subunit M [Candidatus Verstraetearchaeota archaeon]